MTPPPSLTFKNPHALEGWEEFNRWAYQNNPTWNEVVKAIEQKQICEVTGLRYLAAQMLLDALKWRELALHTECMTIPTVLAVDPKNPNLLS